MTIVNSGHSGLGLSPPFQHYTDGLIRWWTRIARQLPAPFLIGVVWFVIAVPPALFRGYHYVEGLTAGLAETALREGYWITPHLHNLRWVERPTLMSWVIAAISFPLGHVEPFVARLPTIVALLAGCLLVWRTLRPVASEGAALLGSAAFLACPIVMRYSWTSVADMLLAILLFGAFLLWWQAFSTGRIAMRRWVYIGCILAITGLLKGPQPVAYFFLGVCVFALITRTWWQLPGVLVAGLIASAPVGLWYAHVFVPGDEHEMLRYARVSSGRIQFPHPLGNAIHFFFEVFPAAILASILVFAPRDSLDQRISRNFVLALSCYAFACTVVLLFWPAGVNARYILPMVLPLCVLGGIGYDAVARRVPAVAATDLCITLALLGYSVMHSTVGQLVWYERYAGTKFDGQRITDLVRNAPGPIYRTTWDAGLNEIAYTAYDVTTIDPSAVAAIIKPAWLIVPTSQAQHVIADSRGHLKSALVLSKSILLKLE